MKVLLLAAAMVISGASFADQHVKKGEGHNDEHQHTTTDVKHPHDDAHHSETMDQHKAHHPDHGAEATTAAPATTTPEPKAAPKNNNKRR